MNWFWLFNTDIGLMSSLLVVTIFLLIILICTLHLLENLKEGKTNNTPYFIFPILILGILIFGMIKFGLFTAFNLSDNERMVIQKVEEVLDINKGFIEKKQGPSHYKVIVNKEEYVVTLSEIGFHVDSIYRNGDLDYELVYQSTEENIDEKLNSMEKLATAKIREISNSPSAFIETYIKYGEYIVESDDKLYTVKVDIKKEEIESVIHNDTYIYKR